MEETTRTMNVKQPIKQMNRLMSSVTNHILLGVQWHRSIQDFSGVNQMVQKTLKASKNNRDKVRQDTRVKIAGNRVTDLISKQAHINKQGHISRGPNKLIQVLMTFCTSILRSLMKRWKAKIHPSKIKKFN